MIKAPPKKGIGLPRPLSAQGPKFGQQRLPPQMQKPNVYEEEEEFNQDQMPSLSSNVKNNRPSTVPHKL